MNVAAKDLLLMYINLNLASRFFEDGKFESALMTIKLILKAAYQVDSEQWAKEREPVISSALGLINQKAYQQLQTNQFEVALSLFKQLIELGQKYKLHDWMGTGNFGVSEVYDRITQSQMIPPEDEEVYAERAYKAFLAAEDQHGCAVALFKLSDFALRRHEFKIVAYYQRQLNTLAENVPEAACWSAHIEAKMHVRLKHFNEAISAYEKCILLTYLLGPTRGKVLEMQCTRQLAGIYFFRTNQIDKALPLFKKVLAWAQAENDRAEIIRCAQGLSLIAYLQNNEEETFSYLQLAVEQWEYVRESTLSPSKQRSISSMIMVEPLVRSALYRGKYDHALEIIERHRARAILFQFQMAKSWDKRLALAPNDLEQYASLQEQDYHLFEQVRDNIYDGSNQALHEDLIQRWKRALHIRHVYLRKLEEKVIEHTNSQPITSPANQIISHSILDDLQPLLSEDIAVVTYWENTAFLITRHRLDSITLPLSHEDLELLERRCLEYREEIIKTPHIGVSHRTSFQRFLELDNYLYTVLIEPIQQHLLHYEKLYFVLTGELWSIPLHALGQARCLSGNHKIAYAFSCPILTRILQRQPQSKIAPSFLGIADPDQTLSGADAEVRRPAALFQKAIVLSGNEGSKDRILTNIAQSTVIHFACHGIFIDEFPEFSFLKLAKAEKNLSPLSRLGSRADDERLEVCTIAQLPISADLVVLSACHSGRGIVYKGDEFVGFPSAFLAAGATTVLGTLWQIDHQATIAFMDYFYEALIHSSKAEAFQYAQQQLSKTQRFSHPYYWAPFVMFGSLV